uniref:Myosin-1-like n=1 Tax=Diabrotica virgifera virgifera TaxID=50390 RepID=A0A6P7G7P1_DIAVI
RPKELEKLYLRIKVNGPCLTSLTSHQEERNKIKYITITTINSENSYKSTLQKVFGDKYHVPSDERIKILRSDVIPADEQTQTTHTQETQKSTSNQSDDFFSLNIVDPVMTTFNSRSAGITSSKSNSSVLALPADEFSTANTHFSEHSGLFVTDLPPLKILSGRCSSGAVQDKQLMRSLEERTNETENSITPQRDVEIMGESEGIQSDSNYFSPSSSLILPKKVPSALQEIDKMKKMKKTQRFLNTDILGKENEFNNEKYTQHASKLFRKVSSAISRKITASDIEIDYGKELDKEKEKQKSRARAHKADITKKVSAAISTKIKLSDIREEVIEIEDDLQPQQKLGNEKEIRKHTEYLKEMGPKVSTDRKIRTYGIEKEAIISIQDDLEDGKEKEEQKYDSVNAVKLLQDTACSRQIKLSHTIQRAIISNHQDDLDCGKDLDKEKEEQKSIAHKAEITNNVSVAISRKMKLSETREEIIEIEDDLQHEQRLGNEKEIRKRTKHIKELGQKVSTDRKITCGIEKKAIMSNRQDDLDYGKDLDEEKEEHKSSPHKVEITNKVSVAVSKKMKLSDTREEIIEIEDDLQHQQTLSNEKEIRKQTEYIKKTEQKVSTDRKITSGIEEEAIQDYLEDGKEEEQKDSVNAVEMLQDTAFLRQIKLSHTRQRAIISSHQDYLDYGKDLDIDKVQKSSAHKAEVTKKVSAAISRNLKLREEIIEIKDDLQQEQNLGNEKEMRKYIEHIKEVIQKVSTDRKMSGKEEEAVMSIQNDLEEKQEIGKEKEEQKDSVNAVELLQNTNFSGQIKHTRQRAIMSSHQDDLEYEKDLDKEKEEQKSRLNKAELIKKVSANTLRKMKLSDTRDEIIEIEDDVSNSREEIIEIEDDLQHEQKLVNEKEIPKLTEHIRKLFQKVCTNRKISGIKEKAIMSIQDVEHEQEIAKEKEVQKDSVNAVELLQETDFSGQEKLNHTRQTPIMSSHQDDLDFGKDLDKEKEEQKSRLNKAELIKKVSAATLRKMKLSGTRDEIIEIEDDVSNSREEIIEIEEDLQHEQKLVNEKEIPKLAEHIRKVFQKVCNNRKISGIEEEAIMSIQDVEHEQEIVKEKEVQKDSVNAVEFLQETDFSGQEKLSHTRQTPIMSSHKDDLEFGKDLDKEKEQQEFSAPKKVSSAILRKLKPINTRQEAIIEIEDDLRHKQKLDDEKEMQRHTVHTVEMVKNVSTNISRKTRTSDTEQKSKRSIIYDLLSERISQCLRREKQKYNYNSPPKMFQNISTISRQIKSSKGIQKLLSVQEQEHEKAEERSTENYFQGYSQQKIQKCIANGSKMVQKLSTALSELKLTNTEEEPIMSIQSDVHPEIQLDNDMEIEKITENSSEMVQKLSTAISGKAKLNNRRHGTKMSIQCDLEYEQKLKNGNEERDQSKQIEILCDDEVAQTRSEISACTDVYSKNTEQPGVRQLVVILKRFDANIYQKKSTKELCSEHVRNINLKDTERETNTIDNVEKSLEKMFQSLDSGNSTTVQEKKTSRNKISLRRKRKSKESGPSSATHQDSILEMSHITDTNNAAIIYKRRRTLCNPNDITILPDQDDEVERYRRRLSKEYPLQEELDLRRSNIIHSTPEKTKELSQSKLPVEDSINLDEINIQKCIEHTPANPIRKDRDSSNSLTKKHAKEHHLLRSSRKEKTKKRINFQVLPLFDADAINLHKTKKMTQKRRHEGFAKVNKDDRSMLNKSFHEIFGWSDDGETFLKEVLSKSCVNDVSKNISSKSTAINSSNADMSKRRDDAEVNGSKIDKSKKRIPNDKIRYADLIRETEACNHNAKNTFRKIVEDIQDDINDGESLMEMLHAKKMQHNIVQ